MTLHQPVTAALVYTGTFFHAPEPKDIRDLGLVFATSALGRMVTLDTLPTAAELHAAPAGKEDPPWEAFCELVVQMTQGADEALRPTAEEVVVWLQSIVDGENLDESASRIFESTSLGSVPAIYELQRDHSPLRRF